MQATRTSEFFDDYAGGFNAIYGNRNTIFNKLVNAYFRKSMRMRYEKVIDGCNPIEQHTVLDIGCGPGHYSVTLARRGAKFVTGVDFAPSMLDIARSQAKEAGVTEKCKFMLKDFMSFESNEPFDYTIVIGFMDYIAEPDKLINKVLALTKSKAFFSFPVDGGLLAWQRKLRYKSRCELFMYTEEQVKKLFAKSTCSRFEVEQISRDFFVTVYK